MLLVGPPGTGKTLLARAVAGEAGVPFFSISGSDFVEMFVGVGASRVRDLFMQGKKHAPCIIFIDEIDAVGRHRGAGLGGGHDEREQTLNQLLVEMDGFESNEGVILIAATNRPDVLDPALLRPGRFDRRVVVPRPDLRGRLAILRVHTRRVPLADDVDLEVLARGTPGFVGADLQNLVNEAALLAARRDAQRVAMIDFEMAKDKVLLGAERRSLIMSDEDKRVTAYHEGGHALVALLTAGSDPVHKVTIIPRGMALGVTQTLPEEDRYNLTREQMLAMIKHAMGGRAAEELVFGHLSTGASNDLQQATRMAREMICRFGMSEAIGPVSFDDDSGDVFLGPRLRDAQELQREDGGADRRRGEAAAHARSTTRRGMLLAGHRPTLDRIAEALLERETLETSDLKRLLEGATLPPLPPPPALHAGPAEARPARAVRRRAGAGRRQAPRSGADARLRGVLDARGPDLPARPRDDRRRAERDARLVLGRRAASRGDGARTSGRVLRPRMRWSRRERTCSTSAANRRGPGASPVPVASRDRAHAAADRGAREGARRAALDRHAQGRGRGGRARRRRAGRERRVRRAPRPGARRAWPRARARTLIARATCAASPRPCSSDVALRRRARGGRRRARASARARPRRRAFRASASSSIPGIGFGKRLAHNLALLANLGELRARLGVPVLVGPSRKAFLGELTGDPIDARDLATAVACGIAVFAGADAVRVHDVAGARRAVALGRGAPRRAKADGVIEYLFEPGRRAGGGVLELPPDELRSRARHARHRWSSRSASTGCCC